MYVCEASCMLYVKWCVLKFYPGLRSCVHVNARNFGCYFRSQETTRNCVLLKSTPILRPKITPEMTTSSSGRSCVHWYTCTYIIHTFIHTYMLNDLWVIYMYVCMIYVCMYVCAFTKHLPRIVWWPCHVHGQIRFVIIGIKEIILLGWINVGPFVFVPCMAQALRDITQRNGYHRGSTVRTLKG